MYLVSYMKVKSQIKSCHLNHLCYCNLTRRIKNRHFYILILHIQVSADGLILRNANEMKDTCFFAHFLTSKHLKANKYDMKFKNGVLL